MALTLAVKHQIMMAYYLDSSFSFFRPSVEMEKVKTELFASFPGHVQQQFHQIAAQLNTVLVVASSVMVEGIKYSADIIIIICLFFYSAFQNNTNS